MASPRPPLPIAVWLRGEAAAARGWRDATAIAERFSEAAGLIEALVAALDRAERYVGTLVAANVLPMEDEKAADRLAEAARAVLARARQAAP